MDEECKGGFLFISHSHKDMDKVRQLRNKLEDAGYEPLCFYLKALDNNEEELDDLIKREIDAREWFVYAVSDKSRESEWVQKERNWRTRNDSKNKQEWKVDLDSDVTIDEISKTLSKGLKIHIIYAHKDIKFVNKLVCKLRQRDFQVTTDRDMDPGSWLDQLGEMIEDAASAGTNIVILSKNSIDSLFVKQEVKLALSRDSLLIPVYIDDVKLEGSLKFMLDHIQSIFSQEPIKDEKALDSFVDMVVDEVRRSLDYYFK